MSTWKNSLTSFLKNGDQKKLLSSLHNEWANFYPEDKQELYRFLLDCNQYETFLILFGIDLKSHSQDLPWLELLGLFVKRKIKIPKEILAEINHVLEKQKQISAKQDEVQKIVEELKAKRKFQFLQRITQLKQELLSSARIAESEGLINQHVKYMNRLKQIYPSEYNVSSLISDQQKQHAQNIMNRIQRRRKQDRGEQDEFLSIQKDFLASVSSQSEKFYQQGKAKASDFAYLLRSLGDKKKSIDFIANKEDSEKKDWELLDYLFYSQQHLTLLDHCRRLKHKYSERPDSLFSVSYIEAIAYWELGEKEQAVYLMSQIASMRPNFKSAAELLSQWKEESFE